MSQDLADDWRVVQDVLVRFYRGERAHPGRLRVDDILAWDDEQLEASHDYIQWLFPLRQASGFNPDAPILDEAQIQVFRTDPQLQAHVLASFQRMLRFYGLSQQAEGARLTISPSADWSRRKQLWLRQGNHNYLRLSRILTSLRLLGREAEAQALFAALTVIYHSDDGSRIGDRTYGFWSRAVA